MVATCFLIGAVSIGLVGVIASTLPDTPGPGDIAGLLLALTLLDRDHQPLTVGLANLQTPHLAQEDLVSAGTIMAILPPLLLFAALNRFYVRGLFAGATKG